MKRHLLIVAFVLPVLLIVAVSARTAETEENKVLRAGIIGLDTSHVVAFTDQINRADQGPMGQVKVVAAYRGGSPDLPISANRIDGFTKTLREKHGVEIVDSIDELLNQLTLIGGGDLCEAAKYSNSDNRDWFTDSFGPSTLGLEVVSERMEAEQSQGRLPLMELPNGDTILLQLKTANGTRPVVYVGTDTTSEPHILSRSFEQFLLDWQRLSYIQPSLEYLAPWIDPSSGRLNPDARQTDALSKILASSLT